MFKASAGHGASSGTALHSLLLAHIIISRELFPNLTDFPTLDVGTFGLSHKSVLTVKMVRLQAMAK